MSRRGSKSADFIGGFKKYDYAIDISADYHIVSGSNILMEFLSKLKSDRANPNLKNDEVISRLKGAKNFLDIIKNSDLNERINKLSTVQRNRKKRKSLLKTNSLKPQFDELIDEVIFTLSGKNKEIIKDSLKNDKEKFRGRIQYIDDGQLYRMDKNALNDYIINLKNEYYKLYLKFIKKPSLNHLFDSANKYVDKVKRLRTIIILIQRDIQDLELINFKVGQRKKGW